MADKRSSGIDFLAFLGYELSLIILLYIDCPFDLVRAPAVSTTWHRFVIENRLCKQLCLKMYPRLSNVDRVETLRPFPIEDVLAMEHSVYSSLSGALTLTSPKRKGSKSKAVKRIDETINSDSMLYKKVRGGPSYLLREGDSDIDIDIDIDLVSPWTETTVHKLASQFCVITGFRVQPSQGDEEYFGEPAIRPKALRISLGHSKSRYLVRSYDWTYTSPVYHMFERNGGRRIRLEEPVLCIGGSFKLEYLANIAIYHFGGFTSTKGMIDAKALGWNLSPEFKVRLIEDTGRYVLKHNPADMLLQH